LNIDKNYNGVDLCDVNSELYIQVKFYKTLLSYDKTRHYPKLSVCFIDNKLFPVSFGWFYLPLKLGSINRPCD